MGCFACGRRPAASAWTASDVLITQTHSVEDAGASNLTRWLRDICDRGGVDAFYEEGLSSSTSLAGKRRRRLRDAFEAARCVVAAAVGGVLAQETERRPPLANEVMWAEQHGKPVVLLYDAGRPFSRESWEAECPFLFRSSDVLVRYYGKGHEESANEVLRALRRVIAEEGGGGGDHAADAAPSLASAAAIRGAAASSKAREEEERLEEEEREARFAALRGRQLASEGNPMERAAALAVLRKAQEAAGPELELPSAKASILHRRPGEVEDVPPPRRRSLAPPRAPPEQRVQEAARLLAAGLVDPSDVANLGENGEAAAELAAAVDATLECLKVGVGVSEVLVAKALHLLVWQLPTDLEGSPMKDRMHDSAEWAVAALRRHGDSPDVCTCAFELLAAAQQALPSRRLSSRDAGLVVNAFREYPLSAGVQRHGFAFLALLLGDETAAAEASRLGAAVASDSPQEQAGGDANEAESSIPVFALRGGGLARIFTRLGTAELALAAVGRHHGDAAIVVDACAVLQSLSAASREVKLLLVARKAARLWVALLTRTRPGAGATAAALHMLASLVTDDADVKGAVGEAEGLFPALERRLQSATAVAAQAGGGGGGEEEDAEEDGAASEAADVLGLLCRLTARHADNKQRCLASGVVVEQAVQQCLAGEASTAARIAAGGLLVNLCSLPSGRQQAIDANGSEAAASLLRGGGHLQRCGHALQQLLCRDSQVSAIAAGASAGDAVGGSAFDGLFAVRRRPASVAPPPGADDGGVTSPGGGGTPPQADADAGVGGGPRAAAAAPVAASGGVRRGSQRRNPRISRGDGPLPAAAAVGGGPVGGGDLAPRAVPGARGDADVYRALMDGPMSWAVEDWLAEDMTSATPSPREVLLALEDGNDDTAEVDDDDEQRSPRGELFGFEDRQEQQPSEAGTLWSATTSARGLKGNRQMRARLDELRAAEAEAAVEAARRRMPFGLGDRMPSVRSTSSTPRRSVAEEVAARHSRQFDDALVSSLAVAASAAAASSSARGGAARGAASASGAPSAASSARCTPRERPPEAID